MKRPVLSRDHIEENEMAGTRGTCEREQKCKRDFGGET
jgi:hypothetical protein